MRLVPVVAAILISGFAAELFAQGRTAVPSRPPEVTIGPPTPRTPLDGKVQGLNLPVFEQVRALRSAGGPGLTAAAADHLIRAIRADGAVDDAEWDLLDELCNARTRSITITPAADSAAPHESVSLTSVAGDTLTRIVAAIPVLDLEKAWNDGASGWAAITAEHGRGGVTALRTVHFVADKLAAEWRQSTTANAYKPVTAIITERYKLCDAVGDEAKTASRTLLREAMVLVDVYDAGKLPDFLYNWIK